MILQIILDLCIIGRPWFSGPKIAVYCLAAHATFLRLNQYYEITLLAIDNPWRRKWQSTPVFLPGESHGQWSLVGYSLWGHKELDMTYQLSTA